MREATQARFSFRQAIVNLTPAFLLSKKQRGKRAARQFNDQLLLRVLHSRDSAHLLSCDIYGPLPHSIFSALGEAEQRFSSNFSIDAIHFFSMPDSADHKRATASLAFLLKKTDGCMEIVAVPCQDVGRFNILGGALAPGLLDWGCENEMTLALVKQEWLWHSLKRRDPRELCVVHPQRVFPTNDVSSIQEGFGELIVHGVRGLTISVQARLEQEDDRRVKAGGHLVRSVRQDERDRLAALLPAEIVDKGLALGESLILSETVESAGPSPSGASLHRSPSRL